MAEILRLFCRAFSIKDSFGRAFRSVQSIVSVSFVLKWGNNEKTYKILQSLTFVAFLL